MVNAAASQRRKGAILMFVAALVWSTAGPLMRLLHLDIWTVQLWRSLSGAAFMIAVLVITEGKRLLPSIRALDRIDFTCALLAAASMLAYVSATAYTTVADVLIVYATLPLVSAVFGWLMWGELRQSQAA